MSLVHSFCDKESIILTTCQIIKQTKRERALQRRVNELQVLERISRERFREIEAQLEQIVHHHRRVVSDAEIGDTPSPEAVQTRYHYFYLHFLSALLKESIQAW